MTIHRLLCCCLAAALSQAAVAESSVNGQALGQVEGILTFCSKLDPQLAKAGSERSSLLTNQVSPEDLAKIRNSAEYKQAYASVSAELAKADRQKAAETCGGVAQGK